MPCFTKNRIITRIVLLTAVPPRDPLRRIANGAFRSSRPVRPAAAASASRSKSTTAGLRAVLGYWTVQRIGSVPTTTAAGWQPLSDLLGKFRVGHLLQPGHVSSVQRFLHREMDHPCGWRGAVPVLFPGRNPHDIAGPDLVDRSTLTLKAADAFSHVQGLPERMGMPCGARARLERHPAADDPHRSLRRDDRVLPDSPGEALFWSATRRPRTSLDNFHRLSPCFPLVGTTSSKLHSAPWSRRSWDRVRVMLHRHSPDRRSRLPCVPARRLQPE